MTFNQKIEILIKRKNITKTEFAEKVGITYRALANYIAGVRVPKGIIIQRIAEELDTTKEFLTDNRKNLTLTSEEQFLQEASSDSSDIERATFLLDECRSLFGGNSLTENDKQALFTCISDIYFTEKK